MVPKVRSEVLHRIADRLAENADVLVRLESTDTGKPLAVSREDVDAAIDTFRFMAGALRSTMTMAAGDYAEDHLSVILREPLGVVGVITPWNYPLLMAAWKIAPILGAGNTLVIKPSEQTPLTPLKFAELVADLLPPGVLNVVTGYGAVAGARLSAHPAVDMIAPTGSVNSGRAVARSAADTLKRVHLELGGKAPAVIFEDADLEAAAAALRVASFWNSGQECGAPCRVLVHESVAGKFIDHLVTEVSGIVVGVRKPVRMSKSGRLSPRPISTASRAISIGPHSGESARPLAEARSTSRLLRGAGRRVADRRRHRVGELAPRPGQ
jgi:aminobutyraldehyde dehydrogenase